MDHTRSQNSTEQVLQQVHVASPPVRFLSGVFRRATTSIRSRTPSTLSTPPAQSDQISNVQPTSSKLAGTRARAVSDGTKSAHNRLGKNLANVKDMPDDIIINSSNSLTVPSEQPSRLETSRSESQSTHFGSESTTRSTSRLSSHGSYTNSTVLADDDPYLQQVMGMVTKHHLEKQKDVRRQQTVQPIIQAEPPSPTRDTSIDTNRTDLVARRVSVANTSISSVFEPGVWSASNSRGTSESEGPEPDLLVGLSAPSLETVERSKKAKQLLARRYHYIEQMQAEDIRYNPIAAVRLRQQAEKSTLPGKNWKRRTTHFWDATNADLADYHTHYFGQTGEERRHESAHHDIGRPLVKETTAQWTAEQSKIFGTSYSSSDMPTSTTNDPESYRPLRQPLRPSQTHASFAAQPNRDSEDTGPSLLYQFLTDQLPGETQTEQFSQYIPNVPSDHLQIAEANYLTIDKKPRSLSDMSARSHEFKEPKNILHFGSWGKKNGNRYSTASSGDPPSLSDHERDSHHLRSEVESEDDHKSNVMQKVLRQFRKKPKPNDDNAASPRSTINSGGDADHSPLSSGQGRPSPLPGQSPVFPTESEGGDADSSKGRRSISQPPPFKRNDIGASAADETTMAPIIVTTEASPTIETSPLNDEVVKQDVKAKAKFGHNRNGSAGILKQLALPKRPPSITSSNDPETPTSAGFPDFMTPPRSKTVTSTKTQASSSNTPEQFGTSPMPPLYPRPPNSVSADESVKSNKLMSRQRLLKKRATTVEGGLVLDYMQSDDHDDVNENRQRRRKKNQHQRKSRRSSMIDEGTDILGLNRARDILDTFIPGKVAKRLSVDSDPLSPSSKSDVVATVDSGMKSSPSDPDLPERMANHIRARTMSSNMQEDAQMTVEEKEYVFVTGLKKATAIDFFDEIFLRRLFAAFECLDKRIEDLNTLMDKAKADLQVQILQEEDLLAQLSSTAPPDRTPSMAPLHRADTNMSQLSEPNSPSSPRNSRTWFGNFSNPSLLSLASGYPVSATTLSSPTSTYAEPEADIGTADEVFSRSLLPEEFMLGRFQAITVDLEELEVSVTRISQSQSSTSESVRAMQEELEQLSRRMNGDWSERIKAVEYGVQKILVGHRALGMWTEIYYVLLAWVISLIGFSFWFGFKVKQTGRAITRTGTHALNWVFGGEPLPEVKSSSAIKHVKVVDTSPTLPRADLPVSSSGGNIRSQVQQPALWVS
ncbi:hypothetical protein SmJEL517_g03694 [Synchytrium microbalum]|uniref:Uncharacterized protein n=1 Tax=Synchytrium microbalum TaxID=1806994 RepID=A0A507C722_9FUNG|nr:uncharacterized protein SmJEL517_g03694 [Synchytrium microbalum]TPX33333.1 hypothetical protein SmJEL517_g03694 [Synchytrium microbalum]